MTGYSATPVFSIVVVCFSVIVFALFFVLRNKNSAKFSSFLAPGLLAAALLGPGIFSRQLFSKKSQQWNRLTAGFQFRIKRISSSYLKIHLLPTTPYKVPCE
jgi:hypothetical protein